MTRPPAEILSWAQALIEPPLRAAADGLPPSMRHVVGYHFGWWDADGTPRRPALGKALRPALTLLSARAAGGSAADAVPAALAVELVHNFSLLHDDVMDRDPVRRHRPAVWRVFGVAEAILAGDTVLAMAHRAIADGGAPAVACLSEVVVELCEGQSADLAFARRDDVRLAECLTMVGRKTGALLGAACALGALSAGAGPARVAASRRFGHHLGVAFQLVDDLLGIWGDPAVTGKPVGADLAARKKSVPVVIALGSGTPAGAALAGLYGGAAPVATAEATRLVEAAGGRELTRQHAETEAAAALAALPDEPAAGELLALARFVLARDL